MRTIFRTVSSVIGFVACVGAAAVAGLAVPDGGAKQSVARDGAPRITQQEFKKLRSAKNVLIIDTRNVGAYRLGHIPGALALPLEGLPSWAPEHDRLVDMLKTVKTPIVTYCA